MKTRNILFLIQTISIVILTNTVSKGSAAVANINVTNLKKNLKRKFIKKNFHFIFLIC
jgi:hypothetical protein